MELLNYIDEFIVLASVAIIALLSPGPDFAFILKQNISYGKRSSLFASIGVGMGIFVHIAYCILGIGLIISKSIVLFSLIKYLGAGYLIYLGYKSFKSKGIKIDNQYHAEHMQMSDMKSFSMGFLCNALNPKATLFFLSVFTVVISPETPVYVQSLYGLFCAIITMIWFIVLSLMLNQIKVRAFINLFSKWFEKAIGTVLILLGLKVAMSEL